MSPLARETMDDAQRRSRQVSSLSYALRQLIERAEIEDACPLIAVAEVLERAAGELDEVIQIQIEKGVA